MIVVASSLSRASWMNFSLPSSIQMDGVRTSIRMDSKVSNSIRMDSKVRTSRPMDSKVRTSKPMDAEVRTSKWEDSEGRTSDHVRRVRAYEDCKACCAICCIYALTCCCPFWLCFAPCLVACGVCCKQLELLFNFWPASETYEPDVIFLKNLLYSINWEPKNLLMFLCTRVIMDLENRKLCTCIGSFVDY